MKYAEPGGARGLELRTAGLAQNFQTLTEKLKAD